MLLDCLRIGVAFGSIALLIAFWYWLRTCATESC